MLQFGRKNSIDVRGKRWSITYPIRRRETFDARSARVRSRGLVRTKGQLNEASFRVFHVYGGDIARVARTRPSPFHGWIFQFRGIFVAEGMAIRADKRNRTAIDLAGNWPSLFLYRFPSIDGIIREARMRISRPTRPPRRHRATGISLAATDKWISRGWKISLSRPFIVVATEIFPSLLNRVQSRHRPLWTERRTVRLWSIVPLLAALNIVLNVLNSDVSLSMIYDFIRGICCRCISTSLLKMFERFTRKFWHWRITRKYSAPCIVW